MAAQLSGLWRGYHPLLLVRAADGRQHTEHKHERMCSEERYVIARSAGCFILRGTEVRCVAYEWHFRKVKCHQSLGKSCMVETVSPLNPGQAYPGPDQYCSHDTTVWPYTSSLSVLCPSFLLYS